MRFLSRAAAVVGVLAGASVAAVTHRLPLDRIAEAFGTRLDPAAAIKVMITG